MLSHITAWTQGRPLLPALRNSGRFLTIPLSHTTHYYSLPLMNIHDDSATSLLRDVTSLEGCDVRGCAVVINIQMKRCLATTLKIKMSTADGTTMPWKPANNLGTKSLKSTSKTTRLKIGRERRPLPEPSGLSKTIFSTHSEHSWNRSN